MISAEEIRIVHNKLVKTYSHGQLLLGGSYLYDEADESSDLDFYLVCNWIWFLWYVRHADWFLPIKEKYPKVRLMLVPKFFFKYGWYYVFGRNFNGVSHVSAISKKTIFRNSLKLACFHYLKYLLSTNPAEKRNFLLKAAQQASVAAVVGQQTEQVNEVLPLFSYKVIKNNLDVHNIRQKDILTAILSWKANAEQPDSNTLSQYGRQLLSIIGDTYELADSAGKALVFMPTNYLIYNFKFIKNGRYDFLFCNPDRYLLKKIITGIKTSTNLEKLYQEMKEMIFPVYVL